MRFHERGNTYKYTSTGLTNVVTITKLKLY